MAQTHPWLLEHPIKPSTKHLIIGTHPPMPYCGKLEFYYGNMNEFWRILDQVYQGNRLYQNGCPDLLDIQLFLDKINMSVTDIVFKTHVEKFSTDNEIGTINETDLNPKLENWIRDSNIDKIYFTSFSGKNSAKNLFKKWYKREFKRICKITKSHINEIVISGRKIQTIDLFSPSPNAKRGQSRIKEYQEYINKCPNRSFDDFRIHWYETNLPKI